MKKSFSVKFAGHPDTLISKARQAAEKNGLKFTGDSENGLLKGLGIEANYQVKEDVLTVNILRKPLLLSWRIVEQKIRALVSYNQNTV
ncbi:MAG: hypothetical protein NTX38_15380 [Methylobacter sp.]|nr:hypothetical protein [Methylobacter sp.]